MQERSAVTRPSVPLLDKTVFQHESWLNVAPGETVIVEVLPRWRAGYIKAEAKVLTGEARPGAQVRSCWKRERMEKGPPFGSWWDSAHLALLPSCLTASAVIFLSDACTASSPDPSSQAGCECVIWPPHPLPVAFLDHSTGHAWKDRASEKRLEFSAGHKQCEDSVSLEKRRLIGCELNMRLIREYGARGTQRPMWCFFFFLEASVLSLNRGQSWQWGLLGLGLKTVCVCVCVCISHSVMSDSAILWTVACQAPLPMGFSRQEYGSGSPFPAPGDLPNPEIEPRSPSLQEDSLPSEPPGVAPNNSWIDLCLQLLLFWAVRNSLLPILG